MFWGHGLVESTFSKPNNLKWHRKKLTQYNFAMPAKIGPAKTTNSFLSEDFMLMWRSR